ncbi:MAG: hypothetical protein ACLQBX_11345 [Candidatus Limnocylindrales bacterium]|jgi:hypothetical protein
MLDNPSTPTPFQVPTAPRTSGSSGAGRLPTTLAAIIAIAGLGFAAGRLTAPVTTGSGAGGAGPGAGASGVTGFDPTGGFAPSGPGGAGQGAVAGGGAAALSGSVESVSGSSLTLKTPSGASVTVELNSSTTYHRQTAATASDVSAGKEVLIQLSTGATSSSAAQPAASGTQPTVRAGDVTIVGQ